MTKSRTPSAMSEETRRQKALEAERLAAALRENLRRRKQQARARTQVEEPGVDAPEPQKG